VIGALFSDLLPYLVAAVAALAAVLGYGARQKAVGRKDAETKAKEADHENATDIRDRVERDLPERVHDLDDAGFRD